MKREKLFDIEMHAKGDILDCSLATHPMNKRRLIHLCDKDLLFRQEDCVCHERTNSKEESLTYSDVSELLLLQLFYW